MNYLLGIFTYYLGVELVPLNDHLAIIANAVGLFIIIGSLAQEARTKEAQGKTR